MFGQVMFPTSRFDELRHDLDRLFDAVGVGLSRRPFARVSAYPAMNIWDAGDAVCVEAELPGVSKDDVEILAMGNELTVKGRRGRLDGDWSYHRNERSVGEFSRTVTLPCDVNADKVEAVLDGGVLTLRLPKAESARPRQIAVKSA